MLSMECNPETQRVMEHGDTVSQHDPSPTRNMETPNSVLHSASQDRLPPASEEIPSQATQCRHPSRTIHTLEKRTQNMLPKKRLSDEMEPSNVAELNVEERAEKRLRVETKKNEKTASLRGPVTKTTKTTIYTNTTPLTMSSPALTTLKPLMNHKIPTTPQSNIAPSSSPINIELETASEILPHPKKVKWGGEDALFIQGRTFGVFDGVSGTKKIKGMPLYSKTLATTLQKFCRSHQEQHTEPITAEKWIDFLWDAGKYTKDVATGSTTAVVASIGQDNILRVVNMGDSALVVIRNGKIISRTKDTGKSFNVPCQLPFCSPRIDTNTSELTEEIFPGDIILAGSDGVFDNLSEESICAIVEHSGSNATASLIAKAIIKKTHEVSRDKMAPTPIAKVYKEMGKGTGFGGKKDDMCCVVVRCKSAKNVIE